MSNNTKKETVLAFEPAVQALWQVLNEKVPSHKSKMFGIMLEKKREALAGVFRDIVGWPDELVRYMYAVYGSGWPHRITYFQIGSRAANKQMPETFPEFVFATDDNTLYVCGEKCYTTKQIFKAIETSYKSFDRWWLSRAGEKQMREINETIDGLVVANRALTQYVIIANSKRFLARKESKNA